jgi:hypothetical protein
MSDDSSPAAVQNTPSNLDFDALKDQFRADVRDLLLDALEGARGDIQMFANGISLDLLYAASIPDPSERELFTRELVGQVKGIAEIQRIRTNEKGWKILQRTFKTLVSALVLAIPSPA